MKSTVDFCVFLVEPIARHGVLLEYGDVGVEEEIGVDNPHRKSSPSAMAMTSAASSMLPIRQRPKSTDRMS